MEGLIVSRGIKELKLQEVILVDGMGNGHPAYPWFGWFGCVSEPCSAGMTCSGPTGRKASSLIFLLGEKEPLASLLHAQPASCTQLVLQR